MSFKATVNADISNFEKNLSQAQKSIDNFAQKVGKQLDKVGDSFIKVGKSASIFSGVVAGVATGLSALAISTAQTAKDLGSLSVITGASTDTLQEYALITAKATVPTDTLATATLNLQRKLRDTSEEGAGASKVLREMGVSFKNLDGSVKSSSQITEEAIKAFAKLEDGIEKSSKGTLVFGGQWQNIAQIADLGADAIDNLKQEAHDLGLVMSEDAINKSANFGIALDVLKLRVTALKNQIGTALAPMLTDTLLPIIENKIMPAFQKFTENIKRLIERFNELQPRTKAIIGVVTGLAIAVGPLLVALGGVLKLLPLLIGGFGALIGPVGLIVAAVAGAAVLIIKNWDNIVDYFTTGDGAVVWETIKNDAIDLYGSLKFTFEQIKGTITNIWEAMTFEVENESENLFEVIARGASNTYLLWSNLWKDFKKARASETLGEELRNIGTMFKNFGIGLVADVVEPVNLVVKDLTKKQQEAYNAARGLGDGIKEVGDESKKTTPEIDALNKEIERLKNRLNNRLKTPIIPKGSFAELDEQLKKAFGQLNEEVTTSGRLTAANLIKEIEKKKAKLELDLVVAGSSPMSGDFGISQTTIPIAPVIDVSKIDLKPLKAGIYEKFAEINIDLNELLTGTMVGAFAGIGEALADGTSVLDGLASGFLSVLGGMAIQVGEMAIGIGFAVKGIKEALMSLNPVVAIAAGVALVALGAYARSKASSIGSGGGGGSSSGGYSSTRINSAPQMGEFEIRDPYRNDKVKFEISGENLVGIYERQNEKALRNV